MRTRIRNLKKSLETSGINYDQVFRSIKYLASSRDTLELYFNGSVGIGEHSEILAEINKWTEKLSQADENIASLKGYFQTTFTGHVETIDDDEPIDKELLKGNE